MWAMCGQRAERLRLFERAIVVHILLAGVRLAGCFGVASLAAQCQSLTPVWVELGPGGSAVARTVIESGGECPALKADGRKLPMSVRTPVPDGFKPACEATLPANTRRLEARGKRWKLGITPREVLVIGDTGCRIKGGTIQACDDPTLWPFAEVAKQVAAAKPDLIVHVGDYLYRESVCPDPVHGCVGPHGDNWETWRADFFEPVKAALPAAPWIFARGNHESCQRSHQGWFYYLDPRPWNAGTCQVYTDPYIAQAGEMKIGVLDTGSTAENGTPHPDAIAEYAKELGELSGKADWIVDHHPFWGFTAPPKAGGKLQAAGLTLGPAWEQAQPKGIRLILSGHVHLFEFLGFGGGRPNQVVAGDSGTQLDTGFMPDRSGNPVSGAAVRAGEVNLSFGFTELKKNGDGWTLRLRDAHGAASIACEHADSANAVCRSLRP